MFACPKARACVVGCCWLRLQATAMATHARTLIEHNGVGDRVTVIQGMVEKIEIPEKVQPRVRSHTHPQTAAALLLLGRTCRRCQHRRNQESPGRGPVDQCNKWSAVYV